MRKRFFDECAGVAGDDGSLEELSTNSSVGSLCEFVVDDGSVEVGRLVVITYCRIGKDSDCGLTYCLGGVGTGRDECKRGCFGS